MKWRRLMFACQNERVGAVWPARECTCQMYSSYCDDSTTKEEPAGYQTDRVF